MKQYLMLPFQPDWPSDIVSAATPGQMAHTREVSFEALIKEPSGRATEPVSVGSLVVRTATNFE
jgi:hypothetical protein